MPSVQRERREVTSTSWFHVSLSIARFSVSNSTETTSDLADVQLQLQRLRRPKRRIKLFYNIYTLFLQLSLYASPVSRLKQHHKGLTLRRLLNLVLEVERILKCKVKTMISLQSISRQWKTLLTTTS